MQIAKTYSKENQKMSEEEEIVPKSRQANAAIAPRRFQQVFFSKIEMENLIFSDFKLNAGLRTERRTGERYCGESPPHRKPLHD